MNNGKDEDGTAIPLLARSVRPLRRHNTYAQLPSPVHQQQPPPSQVIVANEPPLQLPDQEYLDSLKQRVHEVDSLFTSMENVCKVAAYVAVALLVLVALAFLVRKCIRTIRASKLHTQ